jgi:hypothetical protein
LFILFLISILFVQTTVNYKSYFVYATIQYVNQHGVFSYITPEEMELAIWLWNSTPKQWIKYDYLTGRIPINVPYELVTLHSPKLTYIRYIPKTNDTLLISDPYTMLILNGLTGRDTALIERAFIDPSEYSKEALECMNFIKNNIFLAESSMEAYYNILRIRGSHTTVLVVITARTIVWMISDATFVVAAKPLSVVEFRRYLSNFENKELFFPLYSADNVIVYQVNLSALNANNITHCQREKIHNDELREL